MLVMHREKQVHGNTLERHRGMMANEHNTINCNLYEN